MRPTPWWRGRRTTPAKAGTTATLSCREVGRMLQSYLDRELDDLSRQRVAQHLEDCRRCGLEAETYRHIKASLRNAAPELPAEPLDRLRAFADELLDDPPDEQDAGA